MSLLLIFSFVVDRFGLLLSRWATLPLTSSPPPNAAKIKNNDKDLVKADSNL